MTEIRTRAQELLAGRIDAISKLSERQAAATKAREATAEAERDAASAWTEAKQAGWTAGELKKLGLVQPAARRGGRPKGSRTRQNFAASAASDTLATNDKQRDSHSTPGE